MDYEKFAKSSTDDSVFENNVKLNSFIVKIANHLSCFDMIYLFEWFLLLDPKQSGIDDSQCHVNKQMINLIKKWDPIGKGKLVAIPQISETIGWLHTYLADGSDEYIHGMQWSSMFLLNLMTTDLQESIVLTLNADYEMQEHGGMLTYTLMIDKVINLSKTIIENMTCSIKEYNIYTIPGENVALVV
eukprot:12090230-Ditylum_brightwellii.AAC.1